MGSLAKMRNLSVGDTVWQVTMIQSDDGSVMCSAAPSTVVSVEGEPGFITSFIADCWTNQLALGCDRFCALNTFGVDVGLGSLDNQMVERFGYDGNWYLQRMFVDEDDWLPLLNRVKNVRNVLQDLSEHFIISTEQLQSLKQVASELEQY